MICFKKRHLSINGLPCDAWKCAPELNLREVPATRKECSYDRTGVFSKRGFTIIELMVVIVIINLLAGVGVPKLTDLIEKAKERTDLLILYHIRDTVERTMIDGSFDEMQEGESTSLGGGGEGGKLYNRDNVGKWLRSVDGLRLVQIDISHKDGPRYSPGDATKESSTVAHVLEEGGTGIPYHKLTGNNMWASSLGMKRDVFKSRILTKGNYYGLVKKNNCAIKVACKDKNHCENGVVVMFMGSDWQYSRDGAVYSRLGTCFSTDQSFSVVDNVRCKNSGWK